MYVVAADPVLVQIVGKLLGHTLCESGDKHAFLAFHAQLYLLHEVINLVGKRTYLYDRVEQSCGAYYLFHYNAFALDKLIVGGCGAHIYSLRGKFLKLLELERAIVESSRQSEPELHKVCLSGAVTAIHRVYLRNAYVALIYYQQELFGKEVEQTVGACTRLASVEIS